MDEKFETWEEFKNKLNFTQEEKALIDLETDIMKIVISNREKNNISQKQINKIEKIINSSQMDELIQLLLSIGYTIRIVPIEQVKDE